MKSLTSQTWKRTAFGAIEPLPEFQASLDPTPSFVDAIFPSSSMHTYAVIDAAKIFGFQQVLETSGLQHGCLYLGDAQEKWGDVAPWLVRLEADHAITREFLLDKDGPASFSFLKSTALFLTTQSGFDGVLRHLRRFTKVRAEDGRVLLLRFYDPVTFSDLLDVMPTNQVAELLGHLKVTCLQPDGGWYTVEAVPC